MPKPKLKMAEVSDDFVKTTNKSAKMLHRLSRMAGAAVIAEIPEEAGGKMSAVMHCLTSGIMGFLPLLVFAFLDNETAKKKFTGDRWPGEVDEDDILFAALYVTFTENQTKSGRRKFSDTHEHEVLEANLYAAHKRVADTFEKIKGYRYKGLEIETLE